MTNKIFIGNPAEVVKYQNQAIEITAENINDYFYVSNNDYYFQGNGKNFTTNNTPAGSVASTTLIAKQDLLSLTFKYNFERYNNCKFRLEINDYIIVDYSGTYPTSGLISDTWTGSVFKGQSISFSFKKSTSSTIGSASFYDMTGTAKIEVSRETKSVPHKALRAYLGQDKIKKAYIGNGLNKPQLIFSTSPINYYYQETVDNLTEARTDINSVTVGNYTLFAGGNKSDGTKSNVIDIYDNSLVKNTETNISLSQGKSGIGALNLGNYAMFAGGFNGRDSLNEIEVYNNELIKITTDITPLKTARHNCGGVVLGDKAIFGGGMHYYWGKYTDNWTGQTYDAPVGWMSNSVDAYNSDLTNYTNIQDFTHNCALSTGIVIGDYAIFNGRYPNFAFNYHRYTKDNLTQLATIPGDMIETTLSVAINNKYGLFMNRKGDRLVVFDENGTKQGTDITFERNIFYGGSAVSIGKYAIVTGLASDIVWCFDENLNMTSIENIKTGRYSLSMAVNGDKIFFAGGMNSNQIYSSSVEVCEYNEI